MRGSLKWKIPVASRFRSCRVVPGPRTSSMEPFILFCFNHGIRSIDRKALEPSVIAIKNHMQWDIEKTLTWLETENPLLGGVTPVYMIKIGRIHKLIKFIKSLIEENYP